jgi:hypothetical protein
MREEAHKFSRLNRAGGPVGPSMLNKKLGKVMLKVKAIHMAKRAGLAVLAAGLSLGVIRVASAQDAAETAIILGGTGQSAGAQRSLGAGIANSFNAAANTIGTASAGRVAQGQTSSTSRPRARAAQAPLVSGDPLAGTNAPTYNEPNGASIRVSGGLIPKPAITCVKDCP